MKAVILAAGQGTRLKKYTESIPKGMLLFQGRTLIERQIGLFRKCGVEDIIIVRGYAADKINYAGVRYYTNEDYDTTNMVQSFMVAEGEFDEDVIISYSDILFSEGLLRTMMKATGDFAVAVDENWEKYWIKRYGRVDFDTESLKIDCNNRITSIGLENPPAEDMDARYIGLLKFSKRALAHILEIWNRDYNEYQDKPWQQSGKHIRQAYMTDLLNALICAGHHVDAVRFDNGWLEFDTNEDYERAYQWVLDGSIEGLLGGAEYVDD